MDKIEEAKDKLRQYRGIIVTVVEQAIPLHSIEWLDKVEERLAIQIYQLFQDTSETEQKCYVRCSRCGQRVSNTVLSSIPEGIVVRAFVECPECIERQSDTLNPDESRLLTEFRGVPVYTGGEYITVEDFKSYLFNQINRRWIEQNIDAMLEAQDAKTASILQAECQERVERIFREIEERWGTPWNPELDGEWWQALKKKEL